ERRRACVAVLRDHALPVRRLDVHGHLDDRRFDPRRLSRHPRSEHGHRRRALRLHHALSIHDGAASGPKPRAGTARANFGYPGGMKTVALGLAGLLAGTVAGTLLMPRVRAEAPRPAVTVRWQQFCEPAGSITEASTIASARGVDGWELVGFFGGALC